MLSFRNRFHGYNSLRFVYKNGTAIRGSLMTIKSLQNPRRSTPRIAIVVSKKVVKSAVKRNRIRRRVYEVFRLELSSLKESSDIVCIVTSPEVMLVEFSEIQKLVKANFAEARLYNYPKDRAPRL